MMAKFIYVVTSGIYSDYGIEGVFDDETMAVEYVEWFRPKWDSSWEVEKWELNPFIPAKRAGHDAWEVRMQKDGTTTYVERSTDPPTEALYYSYEHYMLTVVMARDERHAVKIANDQRAQLIALGELRI